MIMVTGRAGYKSHPLLQVELGRCQRHTAGMKCRPELAGLQTLQLPLRIKEPERGQMYGECTDIIQELTQRRGRQEVAG